MISSRYSLPVILATALAALICSCGSTATTDDKDIKREALLGTKQDGSDSKVFGRYKLEYREATKKMIASVELRLNGESGNGIRLNPPNRVEIDGTPLTIVDGDKGATGIYTSFYQTQWQTDAPKANSVFQWFQDGAVRTNKTKVAPKISLTIAGGAKLVQTADQTIEFVGDPLGTGDSASLWLDSKEKIKDGFEHLWTSKITAGKTFIIPKDVLSKFIPGNAELRLERVHTESLQEGHGAGGELRSDYEATPIGVVVE
jgi:hypothetical protein